MKTIRILLTVALLTQMTLLPCLAQNKDVSLYKMLGFGSHIRIKANGSRMTGQLVAVVNDTLVLERNTKSKYNKPAMHEIRVSLDEIKKMEVQRKKPKNIVGRILIGTGVGLGFGLISTTGEKDEDAFDELAREMVRPVVVATSAAVGGLVGLLVGVCSSGKKWISVPNDIFQFQVETRPSGQTHAALKVHF